MGSSGGKKPADGGEDPGPLSCAGHGGRYWANRSVTDTGDGEVKEW